MPWARGEGAIIDDFKMEAEGWQCLVLAKFPQLLEEAVRGHKVEFPECLQGHHP